MNTGEIVLLVYISGVVLTYMTMGIYNQKPDVRIGHLFLGPFNGISGNDKGAMFFGMLMWPLAIVIVSGLWIEQIDGLHIIRSIWKVVMFPWTMLVWIFNIRLWPLREKK